MTKAILLSFLAKWCGACTIQTPILEELEKKFKDKVEFIKIDIDENRDLLSQFDVRATPTMIIVKDNTIFRKYVGFTDIGKLESDISSVLE